MEAEAYLPPLFASDQRLHALIVPINSTSSTSEQPVGPSSSDTTLLAQLNSSSSWDSSEDSSAWADFEDHNRLLTSSPQPITLTASSSTTLSQQTSSPLSSVGLYDSSNSQDLNHVLVSSNSTTSPSSHSGRGFNPAYSAIIVIGIVLLAAMAGLGWWYRVKSKEEFPVPDAQPPGIPPLGPGPHAFSGPMDLRRSRLPTTPSTLQANPSGTSSDTIALGSAEKLPSADSESIKSTKSTSAMRQLHAALIGTFSGAGQGRADESTDSYTLFPELMGSRSRKYLRPVSKEGTTSNPKSYAGFAQMQLKSQVASDDLHGSKSIASSKGERGEGVWQDRVHAYAAQGSEGKRLEGIGAQFSGTAAGGESAALSSHRASSLQPPRPDTVTSPAQGLPSGNSAAPSLAANGTASPTPHFHQGAGQAYQSVEPAQTQGSMCVSPSVWPASTQTGSAATSSLMPSSRWSAPPRSGPQSVAISSQGGSSAPDVVSIRSAPATKVTTRKDIPLALIPGPKSFSEPARSIAPSMNSPHQAMSSMQQAPLRPQSQAAVTGPPSTSQSPRRGQRPYSQPPTQRSLGPREIHPSSEIHPQQGSPQRKPINLGGRAAPSSGSGSALPSQRPASAQDAIASQVKPPQNHRPLTSYERPLPTIPPATSAPSTVSPRSATQPQPRADSMASTPSPIKGARPFSSAGPSWPAPSADRRSLPPGTQPPLQSSRPQIPQTTTSHVSTPRSVSTSASTKHSTQAPVSVAARHYGVDTNQLRMSHGPQRPLTADALAQLAGNSNKYH